jgi:hypothetical protein
MPEPMPEPITAESLARRDEWQRAYPGSEMVWVQEADEVIDTARGFGEALPRDA